MYYVIDAGQYVFNCECRYANLHDFRLFVSRALQLPWERLRTTLHVESVAGLVLTSQSLDILPELFVTGSRLPCTK